MRRAHTSRARRTTAALALADIDGDGDLDVVTGHYDWGWTSPFSQEGVQNQLYVNDGTGAFRDVTPRMMKRQDVTQALAMVDVDADGDLDMIDGTNSVNQLELNLLRHLHAPEHLRIGRDYVLDVYRRHGPAAQIELALLFLATAPASIPLGGLGTVGIDPNTMVGPPQQIPQPAGKATIRLPVPNSVALVGIEVFAQAIVAALPGSVRLTSVTHDVVMR